MFSIGTLSKTYFMYCKISNFSLLQEHVCQTNEFIFLLTLYREGRGEGRERFVCPFPTTPGTAGNTAPGLPFSRQQTITD